MISESEISGGGFQARVSRALDLSAEVVFNAWADDRERATWQRRGDFMPTVVTPPGSIQGRWMPDGSGVGVTIVPGETGGCELTIVHSGLSGPAAIERLSDFWKRSIDRMVERIGRKS